MDYAELTCTIKPWSQELSDILTARLAVFGFESFAETDEGLKAYIPSKDFDLNVTEKLIFPISCEIEVTFSHKLIRQKNWNAEWESSFKAVVIERKCMVRAPFHKKDNSIPYDIIIEPKMSFGTAHHETTQLMIQLLLNENVNGKKILDMGCGTGILTILTGKLGAKSVKAIDDDEWAYKNALDNIEKNNSTGIVVQYGNASSLEKDKFDIILANINRNVLINDMPYYVAALNKGGSLIMSGFYVKDLSAIRSKAEELSLDLEYFKTMNDWAAAKFII